MPWGREGGHHPSVLSLQGAASQPRPALCCLEGPSMKKECGKHTRAAITWTLTAHQAHGRHITGRISVLTTPPQGTVPLHPRSPCPRSQPRDWEAQLEHDHELLKAALTKDNQKPRGQGPSKSPAPFPDPLRWPRRQAPILPWGRLGWAGPSAAGRLEGWLTCAGTQTEVRVISWPAQTPVEIMYPGTPQL